MKIHRFAEQFTVWLTLRDVKRVVPARFFFRMSRRRNKKHGFRTYTFWYFMAERCVDRCGSSSTFVKKLTWTPDIKLLLQIIWYILYVSAKLFWKNLFSQIKHIGAWFNFLRKTLEWTIAFLKFPLSSNALRRRLFYTRKRRWNVWEDREHYFFWNTDWSKDLKSVEIVSSTRGYEIIFTFFVRTSTRVRTTTRVRIIT